MSDTDVKAAVRARDGYKCRDCGTTNEQHIEEHGRALDVHRIFPGSEYEEHVCVTLCRACHGKKPKTVEDAFWRRDESTGIVFICFNLYDPDHSHLYRAFKDRAEAFGVSVDHLVEQALKDYCSSVILDFVI